MLLRWNCQRYPFPFRLPHGDGKHRLSLVVRAYSPPRSRCAHDRTSCAACNAPEMRWEILDRPAKCCRLNTNRRNLSQSILDPCWMQFLQRLIALWPPFYPRLFSIRHDGVEIFRQYKAETERAESYDGSTTSVGKPRKFRRKSPIFELHKLGTGG